MTFLWLVAVFSSISFATTPEQVLKTAWEDRTYLSYDEIQKTDSKNPFRNVEAFVSREKNGTAETEVGLKLQLKSWPEWTMGRAIGSEQKLLKDSSLGWALKNRYSVLLLFELNRQKQEYIKEALQLSEKFVQAQNLAMQAGKSTSKTYLSAKADLYKFQRTQAALEQEHEVLKTRLQAWVPSFSGNRVENFQLLSVDDIAQALKEHATDSGSLSKKIAKEEIAQMTQELQIVRGRERQWVKSLELSQSQKEKDDERSYEVQITFQLPFLSSDDMAKQKQNELILKRALKQRDLEETVDQLQMLKVQILNLIDLYRTSRKIAATKTPTLDPLARMERKILYQQEMFDLLNQQQEITALYLDFLLESETLTAKPDKNYLDPSQKALL